MEPRPADETPADTAASQSAPPDATTAPPASPKPAKTKAGARDIGPFIGVTTVRVHGGYEICRGRDEHGQRVTILTMGPSAAENASLRATLAEAYDWARATGGPGGTEFVGADLTGEQPWIASLDSSHPAGVRRLFDRLVKSIRPPAPGQHTGNLPRITDTGSIPRVTDQPPGDARHAAPP
ncbi:MAG: hypothetical protein WCA46_17000, partial [Actinocatenispora sp.]